MTSPDTPREADFTWPGPDNSRVPFWVYSDPDIHDREQRDLFQGPTWNFLCLDVEIPDPGDYKTTMVGDAPIIVVRDGDGAVNAMVNRCAHKGALVCYKPRGNVSELTCIYHNWVYDLGGKLTGVAFQRGVRGKGGMEDDFDAADHGLQRLRVESYRGLIFGSFSDKTPPFQNYIGPEMTANIDRVLIKPLKVLGYHSQYLPHNWKLYVENTKDSYHATLLHVFHNTFGVVRLTMGGGIRVGAQGWHHLSYTERDPEVEKTAQNEATRSLKEQYSLEDVAMMEHRLELGDNITNAIQTVFPTLVIQQILNTIAVRQLVPRGIDGCELLWTVLGFEGDDAAMTELRLKVNNLVGPAGFISMEDGCVGKFVQQGAAADPDAETLIRMGGRGIESSDGSRVTEAAVRGFWKGWRECLKI
jgi:anthranilate 1,2-dioxygenase large subunit